MTTTALPKITATTPEEATRRLRTMADDQHAQYPQYAGHFDHWLAVRVTRPVKLRGTLVFEPGDWALFDPASPEVADSEFTRKSARGKLFGSFFVPNAYGPGTHCVASLPVASFESGI